MTEHDEHFQPRKMIPKMKSWLEQQDFTHFVTLAFNRSETIDSARKKLSRFHANLDRKILGVDWYKKPQELRTFFIAFPEHIDSNIHYHLLMSVNDQHRERFEAHIEPVWKSIVLSGSIDAQAFENSNDPSGYVPYCLKEQYRNQNFKAFVISREFQSQ